MNITRLNASLATLVLLPALSACGGGSGGGINSTPTPVSDAGATAARAVGAIADEAKDETVSVTLTGTYTDPGDVPSGVVTSQSAGFGQGISLVYDATSRAYTIRLAQGGITDAITYRETDRDRTPDRPGFVEYERDAANGDDTELQLRTPGTGGSNLSYVSYGIWERDTDQPGNADFERWAMFVFGQRTAPGDLPSTGTARFNGSLDGLWTTAMASYALSGSAEVAADFGTGQITGTLDATGRNRETGQTLPMDRLTGTATLDRGAAAFGGTLTGGSGFSGNWLGGFFGPQAREVGGTFSVSRNAERAVGVFTAGR